MTKDIGGVVHEIMGMIASQGYSLVNATSVNPSVWINEGTMSFSSVGANETVARVAPSLLRNYGQVDSAGNTNFGVLTVSVQGVTELYYVTIRP